MYSGISFGYFVGLMIDFFSWPQWPLLDYQFRLTIMQVCKI